MAEPLLRMEDISLTYKSGSKRPVRALQGINAEVHQGDFISIIGPSGCGKTSLLTLLSGIRMPTSGRVVYKGKTVTEPSSERVIIFQNYVLYPWKTALENIEFVLRAQGRDKRTARKEGKRYLKLVNLDKAKDRYPSELSGGMQQRVGIARALAADPDILLLDEPFASLDPLTRNRIQEELLSMVGALGKTMVLVTHNIEEAIFLGSRIFVMSASPGTFLKEITPRFKKPKSILELEKNAQFVRLERAIHELLLAEGGDVEGALSGRRRNKNE